MCKIKRVKIAACCMLVMAVCCSHIAHAKKARVLFIGNSYTYVNDLPQITANIAASMGDTLIYERSAPGGYSLYDHSTYTPTLTKIQAGGWDYVVLQDQSQTPALPPYLFEPNVLPYARRLDSLVNVYSPCAETIFYMTWGRKNKDNGMCNVYSPGWPYYCSYITMDSVLRARYMLMADSTDATVSPVGAVWRYVRAHYPAIELYDADESHPSQAGSYAGACSFYTAIFKKPADSISYNYTLSAADAANIRMAAGRVVYDSMNYWHIGQYEVFARFQFTQQITQVNFNSTSLNAMQYEWDFGDGQTSTAMNPAHTYPPVTADYTVRLVATGAMQCRDTVYAKVGVYPEGIADPNGVGFELVPNPAHELLRIQSNLFLTGGYDVRVLNSMGQVVYGGIAKRSAVQEIDISGLGNGVYLLTVSGRDGMVYGHRFIKN